MLTHMGHLVILSTYGGPEPLLLVSPFVEFGSVASDIHWLSAGPGSADGLSASLNSGLEAAVSRVQSQNATATRDSFSVGNFGFYYGGGAFSPAEVSSWGMDTVVLAGRRAQTPFGDAAKDVGWGAFDFSNSKSADPDRDVLFYMNASAANLALDSLAEDPDILAWRGPLAAKDLVQNPHVYWANIENPAWAEALKSEIDHALAVGADGVFLDDVGSVWHYPEVFAAAGIARNRTRADEVSTMMELVIELADYARGEGEYTDLPNRNANFRIVVNNGIYFLDDSNDRDLFGRYIKRIDAVLLENLFVGSVPNDLYAGRMAMDFRDRGVTTLISDTMTQDQPTSADLVPNAHQMLVEHAAAYGYVPVMPPAIGANPDELNPNLANFLLPLDSIGLNRATRSNDALIGTPQRDRADGLAGDDRLYGWGEADWLLGNDGNDTLDGGAGSDTLDGGAGWDLADYFGIARASVHLVTTFMLSGLTVRAMLQTLNTDVDTLTSVEVVQFNGASFAIAGIQQNDVSNVDGNRFDDIILRNSTTGQVAFADVGVSGVGGIGAFAGVLPAGRVARGSGDVTGDGRAEVFVQDTATGSTYFVNTASGTPVLGTVTTNVTADWVMIDQGDLTGDGTIDVLLRRSSDGFMVYADMGAGGVFERWVNAINVGTTDWRTIGLGDFDRDGVSDIAIQNTTNGLTYFANFDAGGAQNGWGYIAGGLGTTWIGKASGDFNGDGFDEMIFQHATNGSVWFVNIASGGLTGQWGVVANNLAGWNVAAVADYDNDGYDDVLMQNAATGTTLIANMDNGAFMGWQTGTSAGTEWMVV